MALCRRTREASEVAKPGPTGPVGNLPRLVPHYAEAKTGVSVHRGRVPRLLRILEEGANLRAMPPSTQEASARGPELFAPSPRGHSATGERLTVRGGSDDDAPGGPSADKPQNPNPARACKTNHLPSSATILFAQPRLPRQQQEPETQYPYPIHEYTLSSDLPGVSDEMCYTAVRRWAIPEWGNQWRSGDLQGERQDKYDHHSPLEPYKRTGPPTKSRPRGVPKHNNPGRTQAPRVQHPNRSPPGLLPYAVLYWIPNPRDPPDVCQMAYPPGLSVAGQDLPREGESASAGRGISREIHRKI